MTRNKMAIVSLATIVSLLGIAGVVGTSLAGDVRLPIHWGLDGQPDQFADKWTALTMPAIIAAAVSLLLYFLPALETREKGLERSRGLYFVVWGSTLLLSLLIQLAVISVAFGWSVHGTSFILAGVGLTFVLIGNQLGKSRSMYLIGIRTPWTLASEEVWIKTHRMAGKLMVAGGLVLTVGAFLPLPSGVIATMIGAVLVVAVAVPVIYSFLLWRRERAASHTSA